MEEAIEDIMKLLIKNEIIVIEQSLSDMRSERADKASAFEGQPQFKG